MATFKPDIEAIIEELITEIDFFGAKRADGLVKNSEKWQLPVRTFDRYWLTACKRYQEAAERKKTALDELRLGLEKEALKSAIMGKHERMEYLTKLATGEIPSWREVITENGVERLYYYSGAEAKAHIAELNKMEGDYAPIKKDITSGGEPLKQITGIIVE